MAVTDEPVVVDDENGETTATARKEETVPPPAANIAAEIEPGTGTGTGTDHQGIDFVTLGMFIIGKLSAPSQMHSRLFQ
ncbi:hypothetical protein RRF57_000488 [Xylaria bambusicola]|uniref:Uncharacterized protein n=1 Tax=Xylaria bambusicola TaxID=326684 RepID=A0AAN7Z0Q9_9PEZI